MDLAERDAAVSALLASARKASARDDARAVRRFAERGLALAPEGDVPARSRVAAGRSRRPDGRVRHRGGARQADAAEAEAAGRHDSSDALWVEGSAMWINPGTADTPAGTMLLRQSLRNPQGCRRLAVPDHDHRNHGLRGLVARRVRQSDWPMERDGDVAHAHGLISREAQALVLMGQVEGIRGSTRGPATLSWRRRARWPNVAGSRMMLARMTAPWAQCMVIIDSLERGMELMRSNLPCSRKSVTSTRSGPALLNLGDGAAAPGSSR